MATSTVWVRQEGEMPGGPIYADDTIARRLTARDYADAHDTDEDDLTWQQAGGRFELFDCGDDTDWFIQPVPVITGEV
jgi:hypothetical protein